MFPYLTKEDQKKSEKIYKQTTIFLKFSESAHLYISKFDISNCNVILYKHTTRYKIEIREQTNQGDSIISIGVCID